MLNTICFKSKHIGLRFCPYFEGVCPDFAQVSTAFSQIFRDFHQIKSFGGVLALHAPTPASYTTDIRGKRQRWDFCKESMV